MYRDMTILVTIRQKRNEIMLNVSIICVGKLKEKFWTDACNEYAKRLKGFCHFSIIEVDEEKLPDTPSPSQIQITLDKEGQRIISKIPKNAKVISMCIEGRQRSSEKLARELSDIALSGASSVAFIIGGSWGLSDEVKNLSDIRLSMSEMTFPHQLARVMLCEQIYRAFQINSHGKYHK